MANTTEEQFLPYSKIANYLIPIGLFSAFVAFLRNSESNIVVKIFYMLIAYLFNVFYLMYVAYKIIFGA